MNLINLKITLRTLMNNKFYTILNISGVALTFIFISGVLMLIRQTSGNYPPEVYKDMTVKVQSILTVNGELTDIDSARVEYYRQLKEPEYIAFMNWQSPFIFNGHKVLWTPSGYVDSDFFNIFRFKYIAGRAFDKNDEKINRAVVLISKEYAGQFFGKQDVLGEKMEIQGTIFTIIGIFEKPNMSQIFGEICLFIPRGFNKYMPQGYTGHNVYLKAKNKNQVKAVGNEVNRLHYQFFQQGIIDSSPVDKEWTSMKEEVAGSFYLQTSIALLFLLLLPAFNILSLNSGKILDQIQEISIKRAYGATRRIILKDIFLENILLTLAGAMLGLLLNYPTLHLLNILFNKFNDSSMSFRMHTDLYIIAGIFILTVIFSLLTCYIPARRVANSNIIKELKGGSDE